MREKKQNTAAAYWCEGGRLQVYACRLLDIRAGALYIMMWSQVPCIVYVLMIVKITMVTYAQDAVSHAEIDLGSAAAPLQELDFSDGPDLAHRNLAPLVEEEVSFGSSNPLGSFESDDLSSFFKESVSSSSSFGSNDLSAAFGDSPSHGARFTADDVKAAVKAVRAIHSHTHMHTLHDSLSYTFSFSHKAQRNNAPQYDYITNISINRRIRIVIQRQ